MSTTRCQAKNPSACTSPRCPARRGGSLGPGHPQTSQPAPIKEQLGNIFASVDKLAKRSHQELLADQTDASASVLHRLSNDEVSALSEYTNQSYSPLNRALRNGRELTPEQQKMVASLDSVFKKISERASEPRRLFRSIRPPDAAQVDTPKWVREQFPPGTVVKFSSYNSTTVSETSLTAMLREKPEKPKQFTWGTEEQWEADVKEGLARNVVLEMVTRDGVSVSALSHMPQEAEVLLPRNQAYIVESIDETTYESNVDTLTGQYSQHPKKYPCVRVRLLDIDLFD